MVQKIFHTDFDHVYSERLETLERALSNEYLLISTSHDHKFALHSRLLNDHHLQLINMIFSRLASIILRIGQFVFAAIVLGLTAYFLYQRSRHGVGPFGRIVFSVIWSSLSIIAAIIWAIPTTSSMTGYVSDFGTFPNPSIVQVMRH